ncbi:MAG: hypothetical protein OEX81_05120 [Candidatus Pacebacteria bacterium]|nr:hypothetical protein [Candidatus Paceibacterota bacterium]
MPEKLRQRMTDVFTRIFGENNWLVTHWLREHAQLDNDLLDAQDPRVLLQILDSFEGKMTIDNPEFLSIVNAWAGVEVKGTVPDLSGLNFIVGNYAGREPQHAGETAFLDPTLWSLFRFFEETMKHNDGKIYAVARDSVFLGIEDRVRKAAEDHMIYAVKKDDGNYELKSRWGKLALMRMVRSGNGILWTAPAASTNMGGLPLEGLTTTSIRQAMEIPEAKLLTLTMETDMAGEKARSIRLDQVDLPQVEQRSKDIPKTELKQLMREVYYQILLYSFAQVASHLPEEQRGQFPDPDLAQLRVRRNLVGINSERVVKVSGGFMD